MNKILEYIAKYGGAGGLIAAFCVYMLCTANINTTKENGDQSLKLLEYRVMTLEAQQKETKQQFSEIQKTLMAINIKVSRVETLIESKQGEKN